MKKITPVVRAQIMLEVLSEQLPGQCEEALKVIRGHTGSAPLVGTVFAAAVVKDLPARPQALLDEIRQHLKTMLVNPSSTDEGDVVGRALQMLEGAQFS
jgi:hypothetical protein